jgi:hypothetical protein
MLSVALPDDLETAVLPKGSINVVYRHRTLGGYDAVTASPSAWNG